MTSSGTTSKLYAPQLVWGVRSLQEECPGGALFEDLHTFLEDPLASRLKLDDAAGNEDG